MSDPIWYYLVTPLLLLVAQIVGFIMLHRQLKKFQQRVKKLLEKFDE